MNAAQGKLSNKEVKALKAVYAKARAYDKKGQFAEAARSYRFFLSQWQPPEPVAYYNYGVALKQLGDYDEAIASYEKAIALKPDYVEAYLNIGSIYSERRAFAQALEQYNKAIALNPLLVEAYYNRGVVLQEFRRHDEALADYDRALALNPHYYLAYLNKSVILYELKRKAEAARNYEQILSANPEHLDAKWNLAVLKLSEGDFAQGWKLYEERRRLHSDDYNARLQRPYWFGEPSIAGKTVFLRWEQGFGDTIQFCRYAKLARQAGAGVILSVQDPLRRLVETLDDGITVIGENEVPEDYDYHCHLMSLPGAFGTMVETIPYRQKYLHADATEAAAWKARLTGQPGVKIGLIWAGSFRPEVIYVRRNDANRSLTLDQFLPMLQVQGAMLISLQKGPPAAQLAASPARGVIHDWTAELTDFAATAALVENLDLVITVDTAVAHLAAALGKPVWLLVPWVSCWRWLEGRTDSPWYDSVKLFRQDERGNWEPVIAAVTQALQNFAAGARGLASC